MATPAMIAARVATRFSAVHAVSSCSSPGDMRRGHSSTSLIDRTFFSFLAVHLDASRRSCEQSAAIRRCSWYATDLLIASQLDSDGKQLSASCILNKLGLPRTQLYPLAVFEEYMLIDETIDHPMTFFLRVDLQSYKNDPCVAGARYARRTGQVSSECVRSSSKR